MIKKTLLLLSLALSSFAASDTHAQWFDTATALPGYPQYSAPAQPTVVAMEPETA